MKEEFDALFAEHQKLLGELQAMRAVAKPEQEPVAWLHNSIRGNVIAHRPADIDRNPDRWIALYTTPPQPKEPEQEPVAWATKDDFYRELERELKRIREEMKIKSVTMRCKDYDIALPIIGTDFGRVLVGQVSTPPQRTWVGLTNDEINNLAAGCHLGNSVQDAIYKAVAKLKEKNT